MQTAFKSIVVISQLVLLMGCGALRPRSSEASLSQELNQPPLSHQDKETIAKALKNLFEDPSNAEKPTKNYRSYQSYQEKRMSLVEQSVVSTNDAESLRISQNISRIDRDAKLMNGETIKDVETLTNYFRRIYTGEDAMQRIKMLNEKEYQSWQGARGEFAKKLSEEPDDKKKLVWGAKITQLDTAMQIKYMWRVIPLN